MRWFRRRAADPPPPPATTSWPPKPQVVDIEPAAESKAVVPPAAAPQPTPPSTSTPTPAPEPAPAPEAAAPVDVASAPEPEPTPVAPLESAPTHESAPPAHESAPAEPTGGATPEAPIPIGAPQSAATRHWHPTGGDLRAPAARTSPQTRRAAPRANGSGGWHRA